MELDSTETEKTDSNADSSSSKDTSSSTKTRKMKKKDRVPIKPIVEVGQALRKLANDDTSVMETKEYKNGTEDRQFFCIEDTILTKDLEVYVEGMGQLSFPLEKNFVEQMITLSSKAKFGKGRETLLDPKVRDTQTIPANKLKIDVNNSSLDDLLKRIGTGLNVSKNSQLILHLHNLLIYGPGQFFKKHTDSEKVQNMIATLVVILPYPHEGGELIIEHNKNKHMFYGSKNPDIVKCVAFFSDCAHEIKKVTNGYRVAITYNVVLQPSDVPDIIEVSESLNTAVDNYFNSGKKKLAFGLNHSYSQVSLKWSLLKGADRTRVNALLAVAKKQGRIPCLALTSYHEVYDEENPYNPYENQTLIDEDTKVNFMIDENNTELTLSTFENVYIDKNEFCCTKKTKELFIPYETEALGHTGNEGGTEEYWYRRACLVIWSSKWVIPNRFKEALSELHQLTKQNGMQNALIEKINISRKDFAQPRVWTESSIEDMLVDKSSNADMLVDKSSIADMLVDIVIYLNDEDEAKFILGDLCKHIMQEKCINRLVQLEKMFSDQTWTDIVNIWKSKGQNGGWTDVVENAHTFVKEYVELVGAQYKSVLIDAVLEEGIEKLITAEERRSTSKYVYYRKRKECIDTLVIFMKICSLLGKKSLEESLINHVVNSKYPAVILGELYTKLMDDLKPENLISFEKIKDLAEKGIDASLLRLKKDDGWTFPIDVTCFCNICSSVTKFFASKTSKSFVIEDTKQTHGHLFNVFYSVLNTYFNPCRMLTDRVGRKYKITFEKLPQLLEDRKILINDLVKFKEKMQNLNNAFVDLIVENEDNLGGNSSMDISNIEITENIKTELQDWIDDNARPYPELTEVNIKSEVTEPTNEVPIKCEEEIPRKRQKNTDYN